MPPYLLAPLLLLIAAPSGTAPPPTQVDLVAAIVLGILYVL